ncbi:hypothetical protein Tco_0324763 [Tanacetum coccineum]
MKAGRFKPTSSSSSYGPEEQHNAAEGLCAISETKSLSIFCPNTYSTLNTNSTKIQAECDAEEEERDKNVYDKVQASIKDSSKIYPMDSEKE